MSMPKETVSTSSKAKGNQVQTPTVNRHASFCCVLHKGASFNCVHFSISCSAMRLDKISRKEFSLPIDQSFFWTDSTCVLQYIENQDKRFQTFAVNRVSGTMSTHNPIQHMTLQGVSADSLRHWIQGQEFLTRLSEEWP